jgi:MYXO-CTERM domain-containing protein
MNLRNITTLSIVSLGALLLATSAVAVAGTNSSDAYISSKKPQLLQPTSHTNQDDEEKSMNIFNGSFTKGGAADGMNFGDPEREDDLVTTVILAFMPVFETDLGGSGSFESGLGDSSGLDPEPGFNPGFITSSNPATGLSGDSGGVGAGSVPAPGVLTLLALAGLSTRRRRRH